MLVDKQNELMSNLLFTSTSMAPITQRENFKIQKIRPLEIDKKARFYEFLFTQG